MTAELRGEFKHDFVGRLVYDSFTAPDFRKLLNPAQRHVIISFLSFYGSIERYGFDSNDVSDAILRYSAPRCDKK